MIKIKNLTKIYKSKKRDSCKALKNITMNLPNCGLVFILGKSGSGKSTLLNLIGGLDNITRGKIVVDGNDLSRFNEKEYCDYRNNHIGFVFQDYHLIDELTVYENICLSLDLQRQEDEEEILTALEKVGLAGYEDRYPNELSGGERQRVAIARAIVKEPKIILADEPTGNLDTITATQIVELLKGLSNECLIIIVSHNRNDAYSYADRIIELKNGEIINDEIKNSEYDENLKVEGNIIYYPEGKLLNDDDIDLINRSANKNAKIVKAKDKYIKNKNEEYEERYVKIRKVTLTLAKELMLSLKFLKSKVLRIFLSSFMVSAIMVIMALAQTVITFNGGQIVTDEMNKVNQTSFFIEKDLTAEQNSYYNDAQVVEIGANDLDKFKSSGYKGKIYEVLNYTIPIVLSGSFAGCTKTSLSSTPYLTEALGTMIIDESFLSNKFGKIEYVAKLDQFHPSGVIITDYLADSIRLQNVNYVKKPYEDLLGSYTFGKNYGARGYINGIIKTNYKETYNDLIKKFENKKITSLAEIAETKEAQSFASDVYSKLGFCYTFNKDFIESNYNNPVYETVWHHKLNIDGSLGSEDLLDISCYIVKDKVNEFNFKEKEVAMEYKKYNAFFNTNYTPDNLGSFVPHQVSLKEFRFYDEGLENVLYDEMVTIKAIYDKQVITGTMIASDDVVEDFRKNTIYTKGLYFDGNENINKVLQLSNELSYEHKSLLIEGIHTMTKAVDVFIPIFRLIAIVLCIGIVFIIVNFSMRMINDKMHEIGILKALGTQNQSIGIVFGLQVLLIAFLTIIMSTIGYLLFIDLANDVLIASLKQLASSHIVLDLNFLTFKLDVVGINIILILVLCIFSLLIPLIKIKRIKPVEIIKAKE